MELSSGLAGQANPELTRAGPSAPRGWRQVSRAQPGSRGFTDWMCKFTGSSWACRAAPRWHRVGVAGSMHSTSRSLSQQQASKTPRQHSQENQSTAQTNAVSCQGGGSCAAQPGTRGPCPARGGSR
ncbi:unnamed protein product [Lepidochelys kempii]